MMMIGERVFAGGRAEGVGRLGCKSEQEGTFEWSGEIYTRVFAWKT